MKNLFLALLLPLALAAGGCDRKPTDPPKPKTSIGKLGSPATQDARYGGHTRSRAQWI